MFCLKRITQILLILPLSLMVLVSCSVDNSLEYRNLVSILGGLWEFNDESDYTFDENFVEIKDGKAQLKTIESQYSDFSRGTHVGTSVSGNTLTLAGATIATTSNHVNTILPNKQSNLKAYWRMENNWLDSVGPSHGTAAGSNFVAGQISPSAGSFSGAYTSYSHSDSLNMGSGDFTFSVWVNTTSVGIPALFSKGSNGAGGKRYGLFVWGGKAFVEIDDNTALKSITSLTSVNDGSWHQIAVVRDGNSLKIYVDGIEDAIPTDITGYGSLDSTRPGCIGCIFSEVTETFSSPLDIGSLDEIAVWDTALSSSEISNLYSSQVSDYIALSPSWTPHWDNIVGYWKMDGNWQDSSGNGNHGTVNGTPSFSTNARVGSNSGSFNPVTPDYIQVTDSDELDNTTKLTISLWVNDDNCTSNDALVSKRIGADNNQSYTIWCDSSQAIMVDIDGTNDRFMTTLEGSEGSWNHVVVVFDGAQAPAQRVTVYINGESAGVYTETSASIPNYASDLFIGYSGTSAPFGGLLDEIGIWNESLTQSEIKFIYNRQKQKYAGHYESPVIDLGASGSWTSLSSKTSLPFYKEISTSSESSSDYSSLSGDLSNGLVGYWKFNEPLWNGTANEVIDSSGSNFHGVQVNSATANIDGILQNAGRFDKASVDYLDMGDRDTLDGVTELTVCAWAKTSDGSGNGIISKSDNLSERSWLLYKSAGTDAAQFYITNTPNAWDSFSTGTTALDDGKWHFICGTYDGAAPYNKIFVDGVEEDSVTAGVPASTSSNTQTIKIGAWHTTATYSGDLDEVSVWSRALTPTEIQQLYRRGANRVKYQVKSCVDSSCECKAFNTSPVGSANDCDGDGTPNATDTDDIYKAEFMGPGGNGVTAFSELFNRDSGDMTFTCNANTTDSDNDVCVDDEITLAGDSNTSSPSFSFSDFPSSAQPSNNRYFQYRVMMEAEENTACGGEPCLPELTSVEVGPTGRYFSGSPSVVNKTSHPIDKALDNLQASPSSGCNMSYQISNDGTNFYYWDGSSWATGASVSQSNDLVTLNNNLSSFTEQIGLGDFYFKSYLGNSNFGDCEIDKVQIIKSRR